MTNRRIPNLIHFICLIKPGNEIVPFLHFAAVASAKSILRPDKIILHLNGNPQGPWWERIRPLVDEIKLVALPTHWRHDKPIYNPEKPHHYYSHMSDHIRLHALAEIGGIYLDLDTITIRPVNDLLQHEFVIGKETCSPLDPVRHRLGSAVLMAAPGSAFLLEWMRRYPEVYDSADWASAATLLPATISQEQPGLPVNVVPETAFFSVNWDDVAGIFEEPRSVDPEARILHLWQNMSWEKYFKRITGMDWARQNSHTVCATLLLNAESAWIRDGIDYGEHGER
ncbi:uncharacterized protein C8A04DRAFT_24524 [Dichotomopilus funicola]|uniref:Glycosyltransferase family 32 protein n=1 Tax=Dichotomopilus funicola TaxID=1934379 RepID=A0AAN6V9M5_9PEZI|nr:hypothetical protein C8A04DRAFT_24524 [Dichotomopilus funicola]